MYEGRHFSVRVPHLPTQALRRLYYCQYHKRQCVKFQLTLTHEDIVVDFGMEQLGSAYDKRFFMPTHGSHTCPKGNPPSFLVYYKSITARRLSITQKRQKSNPS